MFRPKPYAQIIEDLIPWPKARAKFYIWAFGETLNDECHIYDVMLRWNMLHKDILELDPVGSPSVDIAKMVDLWKDHLGPAIT